MNIRPIRKEELIEAKQLSAICFEYPFQMNKPKEEYLNQLLASPDQKGDAYWNMIYGAFTEQNELMSCLNVIPYQFYFDGSIMNGTGIGNVVTYPHHRKKGAVKKIFQTILPEMYKNKIAFSYLYPFSESFYRKYGYERSCTSIGWNLDLSKIPCCSYSGSFHLYSSPSEQPMFEETYKTFASSFNMMVNRDKYDWTILKEAKAAYNNTYAYLYKNDAGIPCGYIIFKKDFDNNQAILNCRELVYNSFSTLQAIMSFLSTYASDYKRVHFYGPSTHNLQSFCTDFAQSSSYMTIGSNGMIRAIHVPSVLKQANYKGSGEITIELFDQQIIENNGVFHIIFESGKAVSIEKTEHVSPDVSLPVSLFSSAIVGNYTPEQLLFCNDLTLHCTLEKLSCVFYKKPCWINNYF
ncbi:GNAT family N-acetyltransferase [Velocimicrobium porci]|uniref:GNAT family N-acetyltransferase n=1 Tax=Velocimicrobium porci TaxID=2606634 RepID=A0A6L5XXZ3_9FIRM|nr:GNAT family N-acetyltransferase [Velocimicrobium porci]MSS63397.1 GNAT family N-acetyltransferase [Velocimicrobium porci]